MKYALFIFSCLILISCSDPGYSVRININDNANATESDIKLLTEYLQQTKYDVVMIEGKDNWKIQSYKILLDVKDYDGIGHKYINFVVEYYYNELSKNKGKILKKIEVRIGNSWEGRNPILKKEIDIIADQIVKVLTKRFNKSNFSEKRKFVTPM